ncbi:MAG: hypothetical protein M1282_00815 [Chloroflexi bacterium]|nr:hypothetical protein [Chloroflexota bacterium]
MKRNRGQRGYRPQQADGLAGERRPKGIPRITAETWTLVEKLFRQDWSPERISGRLKKEQTWGFGIGGVLGLIGLIFGIHVGKNVGTLGNMAAQIQGKPTPEQMNKIQAAQKQLAIVGPISTTALILALACMATARYWQF